MPFAVWRSCRIRQPVAMCSASSTLRGRPNLVPLAREAAPFKAGGDRCSIGWLGTSKGAEGGTHR